MVPILHTSRCQNTIKTASVIDFVVWWQVAGISESDISKAIRDNGKLLSKGIPAHVVDKECALQLTGSYSCRERTTAASGIGSKDKAIQFTPGHPIVTMMEKWKKTDSGASGAKSI